MMRRHLNDACLLELLDLHLLLGCELASLHLVTHRWALVELLRLLLRHVALPLIIVSVSVLIILIVHLGLVAGSSRPEEGLTLRGHSGLLVLFSLLAAEVWRWFALVVRHAEERRGRALHVALAILLLVRLSVLKRII